MSQDKTAPPQTEFTPTRQELVDIADAQLEIVALRLKEVQKVLRRDWPNLTPRQRSELSREVKELERQQNSLHEEIKMLGPV
jgi:FtsZ-binding cell division protein ZapB